MSIAHFGSSALRSGRRLLIAAALSLAANLTAHAQLITTLMPALPEIVTAPSGVSEVQVTVAKTQLLRWRQYLATPLGPVDPAYLVVCVQAPTVACTWQASSPSSGVWSGAAKSSLFTRTEIRNSQKVLLGYNYSLTVSLDRMFFDRPLKWTVGACAVARNNSCTFATATPAKSTTTNYYSTKNVRPDRFAIRFFDGPLGPDYHFVVANALVGNYGTTNVGPFSSEVIGMKALIDPNNMDMCETNPNRPGLNLPDSALLITSDGRQIRAGDLRSGGSIGTGALTIVAISLDGPDFSFNSPTSPDTFLSVGEVEVPASHHVVRVVQAADPIPPPGSRVGIVAIAESDYSGLSPLSLPAMNNRIVEFNEGDNFRVRCTVMIW